MNIWTGLLLNQGHIAKPELGRALAAPAEATDESPPKQGRVQSDAEPRLARCLESCALALHVRWAGFR